MSVVDRLMPILLIVAGPIIAFVLYSTIPWETSIAYYVNAFIYGGLVSVFGLAIWPISDLRVVKGKERRVMSVAKSQEEITIDELSISTGFEPGTIRLLLYDAINDETQRSIIKSRVYMDTGTHAPGKVTPTRCPIFFIIIGGAMVGVGFTVLGTFGIFGLLGVVASGLVLISIWPTTMYVGTRLAKQRVIGAAIAHETISLLDISSLTGQPVKTVTRHLYAAIKSGLLKGTIREGVFVIEEKDDVPTPVPERKLMGADIPSDPIEGVEVLRGCASIGGAFEYKVKVQNKTDSLINKVTVSLISYPEDCMILEGEMVRRISMIEPDGFRSPQFILKPTKDCVEGQIVSSVSFLDHLNEVHTLNVEPYVIKSVCDLLQPLESTIEKLEFMLYDMASNSEKLTLNKAPDAVFTQAKTYLPQRNFSIIEEKSIIDAGEFRATLRCLAEGKYTHNKVAIRLVISGQEDGVKSDILIEALADDASMIPITIEEISQGLQE